MHARHTCAAAAVVVARRRARNACPPAAAHLLCGPAAAAPRARVEQRHGTVQRHHVAQLQQQAAAQRLAAKRLGRRAHDEHDAVKAAHKGQDAPARRRLLAAVLGLGLPEQGRRGAKSGRASGGGRVGWRRRVAAAGFRPLGCQRGGGRGSEARAQLSRGPGPACGLGESSGRAEAAPGGRGPLRPPLGAANCKWAAAGAPGAPQGAATCVMSLRPHLPRPQRPGWARIPHLPLNASDSQCCLRAQCCSVAGSPAAAASCGPLGARSAIESMPGPIGAPFMASPGARAFAGWEGSAWARWGLCALPNTLRVGCGVGGGRGKGAMEAEWAGPNYLICS